MQQSSYLLVPTDFSPCAHQALRYALDLAQRTQAGLLLYHAVHLPVGGRHGLTAHKLVEQMQADAHARFGQLCRQVPALAQVPHQTLVEVGYLFENVVALLDRRRIDLIVMGTRGAHQVVGRLLGSNASRLMGQGLCPVLAVPERIPAPQQPPRRILFATDYATVTTERTLQPLVALAQAYEADITVLKVVAGAAVPPNADPMPVATAPPPDQVHLQMFFERVRASYYLSQHDDVEEGIEDFIRLHHIDLLAMMPRRHSVFRQLFHGSHTRRMALRTDLPLFSFPG